MAPQMMGMPVPPKPKVSPPKRSAAEFSEMRQSKPPPPDPYVRTGARTGTTFDMADLLTCGTATKVPHKNLPSTDQKMQVLNQSEQTLPGDTRLGMNPDTTDIIDRMSRLIRSRNLDLLNLMDDFLKRPRGSRMPVRNRAFLDVSTFKRALAYAFGDQWTGLSMTSAEFERIWKQYERKDVSHSAALASDTTGAHGSGYQGGGAYGQGQGQPEALVLWQSFAQDVQRYTDGDNRSDAEKALLAAELELIAKSEAAEAAALAQHDGDDNMGDAKARLAAKRAAKQKELQKPIGTRGATVGQVEHAKKRIAQKLTGPGGKYDTVREALRDIDNSGDGILTRDEVKLLLNEHYLLKFVDFYTGRTLGELDELVIDTMLDLVDKNGDGTIGTDEFAEAVFGGANSYFYTDMADGYMSTFDVQGM